MSLLLKSQILWRLFICVAAVTLAIFVYRHTIKELEYHLFPFAAFFMVTIGGLASGSAQKKWAWFFLPCVVSGLVYVAAKKYSINLIHNQTAGLRHQFGLCAAVFFMLIFAWIVFAPARRGLTESE